MKILVAGGGIAARVLARSVLASNPTASIIILESRPTTNWENDRGIGLWPQSIENLRQLQINIDHEFHSIPPALYRNNTGTWLSRCSDEIASSIRVRSIRENRLLMLLHHSKVMYRHNTTVTKIISTSFEKKSGVAVTLSTGETLEGDVCVVASGGGGGGGACSRSLSGIIPVATSSTTMQCLQEGPFETLVSSGTRFAMVPLSTSSMFWFATFPSSSSTLSSSSCLSSTSSTVNQITSSSHLSAALRLLKGMNFHVAVDKVLEETDRDTLLLRDTYSGGAATVFNDGNTFDRHHPHIIPIGDAAHHLPNNLAQGGSIAIEDGYMLGCLLGKTTELKSVKKKFEQSRRSRVTACRRMNILTQQISTFSNISNFMQYVPFKMNQKIFDISLCYSLYGKI